MATITIDRFDFGLDVTKAPSVADANRMRALKNCYVTTGRAIRKRNGLSLVTVLESGTKGLVPHNGKLHTFYGATSTITHANTLFQANQVNHDITPATPVTNVHFGEVFNNAIYVSVEYQDGRIRHHYLDGTVPPLVADAACPHTKGVSIQSKKVFAVGRITGGNLSLDSVSFTRTDAPRDWSTLVGSDAAGFIPTSLQGVSGGAQALGRFRSQLAIFGRSWMQTWTVDPNPANMRFADSISGVGTAYHRSIGLIGPDVFFLSDIGVRSATTLTTSGNLSDRDVGTAIDKLIKAELAVLGSKTPVAYFNVSTSQYWLAFGANVYVFTFSRSAKIAAWSLYTFSSDIDVITELDGVTYLRSANTIYKYDEAIWADAGIAFESRCELPYLSAKSPAVMKQFIGVDVVMTGTADVSFGYDSRNVALQTTPYSLSGATAPGESIPVEAMATELSPIFVNNLSEEWTLDSVSLHFNTLGVI